MRLLRYFGMIFFDSTNDNNADQKLYTFALLCTGVSSMVMIPSVAHEFDDWSEMLSISFSALTNAVAAFSTIVSSLTVLYNMGHKYQKYKTTLESFEIYIPGDRASYTRIRRFSYFSVLVCCVVILPVNAAKLWNVSHLHARPVLMTSFLFFYYVQNFSSCCTELHFAFQCYTVHSKFQRINDELRKLTVECRPSRIYSWTGSVCSGNGKEPCGGGGGGGGGKEPCGGGKESCVDKGYPRHGVSATVAKDDGDSSCVIVYERDFYRPKNLGYPMANAVELLRIKHWLTREAVNDLNSLFGVQIGLSIFNLIVVTSFDVYSEVFHAYADGYADQMTFRSKAMFAIWMVQHSFRFCIIVITAHITTKQAVETKRIVTEMNNRHLDVNTKEELQLFYSQLSTCSIQLTVCDIFTLNNNLFTSAVAALATYSMMLVQCHSKKKQ